MAKQLQIRGGTTVQHSTFTGALREITIDTDKDVVVVHDGTTVGGFPLAKQTSVDSKVNKVTSTDNAVVRFNGVTGEVQNSNVIIDDNGNLGVGGYPYAKLSTLGANNAIAETIFMAGISGVTNGFIISKDSVANPNYKFLTTNQATGLEIDNVGNVLLKSGIGAFGYGTGAGGTVTQLTSKSTAVTLNKPSGRITMHNEALAAGASVSFNVNNNLYLVNTGDVVVVSAYSFGVNYRIEQRGTGAGTFSIKVTNITGGSLSDSIAINFTIIKGATA